MQRPKENLSKKKKDLNLTWERSQRAPKHNKYTNPSEEIDTRITLKRIEKQRKNRNRHRERSQSSGSQYGFIKKHSPKPPFFHNPNQTHYKQQQIALAEPSSLGRRPPFWKFFIAGQQGLYCVSKTVVYLLDIRFWKNI